MPSTAAKLTCAQWRWSDEAAKCIPTALPHSVEEKGPEENLPLGHSLEWTDHMQNVFSEKWPSLLKFVLVAGVVLFVIIRWA